MYVIAITFLPLVASLWKIVATTPVVFESNGWNGDDGQFSTFELSVGTPPQSVNLLPVPFRNALVVVGSEGCQKDSVVQDCVKQRGNVYDSRVSQSWHSMSMDSWDATETRIRPPRIARNGSVRQEPYLPGVSNYLGTDSVSGQSFGKQWSIQEQGILSTTNMYPFVGLLGLSTNVGGPAKNPTPLLDQFKGNMKSVSWSYTAGNKAKNIPGSLIFGGFDETRLDQTSKITSVQREPQRRFQVVMNSINVNGPPTADRAGGRTIALGPINVDLNFSEPDLEFPKYVCENIEEAWGMTWDQSVGHYVVNDTRHDELIKSNTSVAFELVSGNGVHRSYSIPYETLVINAMAPMVDQPTRYIAIRPHGGNHYNFGRVFFQSAVITVHFDNPRGPMVHLHQAKYNADAAPQIHEIDSRRGLKILRYGGGDKLGIVLPVVFCGLALIAIIAYLLWARRVGWIPFLNKRKEQAKESAELENATAWSGDRKEEPQQFASGQSNAESVYYEAQTEINHDDPLEGSSHPPPRYSVAIAEAQSETAASKAKTENSS